MVSRRVLEPALRECSTQVSSSMRDSDCVAFLQWALPRMQMRWAGYRKVRHQVCKRISRRMQQLEIASTAEYRTFLERSPDEWRELAASCRVTISRFHRDKAVFQTLASSVLPQLLRQAGSRGERTITVWSAGCGSGEEPFTVALCWRFILAPQFPDKRILILGTDAQPQLLRRALQARYRKSALREVPVGWWTAFDRQGPEFLLRTEYRAAVYLVAHDLRTGAPGGQFDVVLCRNLAFTYWDESLQSEALRQIHLSLKPGGVLVVGSHEALPADSVTTTRWPGTTCIFRKPGA
jgi:chemotaxis protein methyltransferase CheR